MNDLPFHSVILETSEDKKQIGIIITFGTPDERDDIQNPSQDHPFARVAVIFDQKMIQTDVAMLLHQMADAVQENRLRFGDDMILFHELNAGDFTPLPQWFYPHYIADSSSGKAPRFLRPAASAPAIWKRPNPNPNAVAVDSAPET